MDATTGRSHTEARDTWGTLMLVLSTVFCFLLVFLATPALILLIAHSLF